MYHLDTQFQNTVFHEFIITLLGRIKRDGIVVCKSCGLLKLSKHGGRKFKINVCLGTQ